ncbi:hypothetical protein FRX31_001990 [Thalictrum thalictroides]|uniref:3'-5' exonuclease domain-containing protein n=1 Tax=Thalictrum thalictroides TaxID=46969 RepID=A0A7J6XFV8_THATH|nr:hypothetical protein FRX31_001990 [Thalictrum thalictroides]
MEVTIERNGTETEKIENRLWSTKEWHEAFTVQINGKRILTIYTSDNAVMKKWINEVQKLYGKKKNTFPLIVSVCVDRESKHSRKERPYEIIALCTGSHCLLYSLPDCYWNKYYNEKDVPKPLLDFLTDSKAIFVGMDIVDVSKKLEKDSMLKIKRSVDIRGICEQVLGYPMYHMKKFGLDEIAKKMLDKRMEIGRLEIDDNWIDVESRKYEINKEYVKYLTVDAFFLYEIAVKYLDITTMLVSESK